MNLLTTNTKLEKSIAEYGSKILTAGLFLAPHRRSGHNVCPNAGHCSVVCNLWFAGRTVTSPVREAMLRRTRLYFGNPAEFFDQLYDDLESLLRKGIREGKQVYVRLNGSSDLDFSKWGLEFPEIEFYDYTKRPDIITRCMHDTAWPANYNVCYSLSERADTLLARDYLKVGGTVSVVFDTEYCPQHKRIGTLPKTTRVGGSRFRVIDGDKHDLRHPDYDEPGCVVGLRFKGSRSRLSMAVAKGFVRRTRKVSK